MRNDLAIEFNADFTCPMTTGIFLMTVIEPKSLQRNRFFNLLLKIVKKYELKKHIFITKIKYF